MFSESAGFSHQKSQPKHGIQFPEHGISYSILPLWPIKTEKMHTQLKTPKTSRSGNLESKTNPKLSYFAIVFDLQGNEGIS